MKKSTPHIQSHQLPDRWFLVDADGRVLGRLATGIAKLLMGKDRPQFNRAVDAKTNVVVVNASAVKLTGNKLAQKLYHRHSGYTGGLKTKTAQALLVGQPTRVLEKAVAGMLPKNKLRYVMLNRLKIYAGADHPHIGQQPTAITL